MANGFTFLILIIAGLACGFVDSMLGMGYGVTAVTVMITFGVAPAVASASIHTAEAAVDIVSAGSHWKLGNVEKDKAVMLLLTGIPGAVLGAIGLSLLALNAAKPLVAAVLLMLGLLILYKFTFRWKPKSGTPKKAKKYTKTHLGFLGFIAGFIDTSAGGGWGPVLTSSFVASGSEPCKAVGTVEFTEPLISLAATATFGYMIGFDAFLWVIVIPMIIGGILLTPLAAYLCKKIPHRWLGIMIGLWVAILNARTLISSL